MSKLTKLKTKKITISKILKNYKELIDDIKTLNGIKKTYNEQILKTLGYDESKPKKLYTKQIGKHIVMCKINQSYSLDLTEVKKEFPILDVSNDEKKNSKFYKENSVKKEIIVEVNND